MRQHSSSRQQQQPTIFCLLLLGLLCSSLLSSTDAAARFVLNGPVITVTLKEPLSAANNYNYNSNNEQQQESTNKTPRFTVPWLDLAALSPNVVVQLTSSRPPLPNWMPNLKQVALRSGYQYHSLQRIHPLPSYLEATAKFSTQACDILVQPAHQLDSRTSTCAVELSRGPHWISAKFGSRTRHLLSILQGSFLVNLPYASLSSVRIQPTLALGVQQTGASSFGGSIDGVSSPSYNAAGAALNSGIRVEAVTGNQGRTKAVLNYVYPNPSLSVWHQIDARNSIAPTIFLNTAKMMYQWNLSLRAGSSLVTKVDPTSAIYLTWTDTSASGGGSWVTDLKLPLEATSLQALAADIRVRRQFSF